MRSVASAVPLKAAKAKEPERKVMVILHELWQCIFHAIWTLRNDLKNDKKGYKWVRRSGSTLGRRRRAVTEENATPVIDVNMESAATTITYAGTSIR